MYTLMFAIVCHSNNIAVIEEDTENPSNIKQMKEHTDAFKNSALKMELVPTILHNFQSHIILPLNHEWFIYSYCHLCKSFQTTYIKFFHHSHTNVSIVTKIS